MEGDPIMEFSHHGYRYQILHLPSLHRMQLWYLAPQHKNWALGHGKDIPAGWTVQNVATAMSSFITGHLTYTEYNQLLPS